MDTIFHNLAALLAFCFLTVELALSDSHYFMMIKTNLYFSLVPRSGHQELH